MERERREERRERERDGGKREERSEGEVIRREKVYVKNERKREKTSMEYTNTP
jgi:hypothetical protein